MVKSSPKSGRSIDSPLTKIRLSILGQGFESSIFYVIPTCLSSHISDSIRAFMWYGTLLKLQLLQAGSCWVQTRFLHWVITKAYTLWRWNIKWSLFIDMHILKGGSPDFLKIPWIAMTFFCTRFRRKGGYISTHVHQHYWWRKFREILPLLFCDNKI